MRFVGQGHYFHPESGKCTRCALTLVDPDSAKPCAKAPRNPHPPRASKKAPDLYEASRKQAE